MVYARGMDGDDRKPGAPPTPMSRTATLDDPLTTQVLAEIARRAQTMELDPEALKKLTQAPEEEEDTAETAHPHLRKRG